jgi:hypothetical protein
MSMPRSFLRLAPTGRRFAGLPGLAESRIRIEKRMLEV